MCGTLLEKPRPAFVRMQTCEDYVPQDAEGISDHRVRGARYASRSDPVATTIAGTSLWVRRLDVEIACFRQFVCEPIGHEAQEQRACLVG
jgi:hypothetical protein